MVEILKVVLPYILGFMSAVLAEPVRRCLLSSAITTTFRPSAGFGSHCFCVSPTTETDVMSKYVRVTVECSSALRTSALGCRPFLTRIERLEPEYVELHHDPVPLNWSYVGHQPLDITSGMRFYVDIVAVNNDSNSLQPQTTVVPATWTASLAPPGKYRFSVMIPGDNVLPSETAVTFLWDGNFDSLTLKLLRQHLNPRTDPRTSRPCSQRPFSTVGDASFLDCESTKGSQRESLNAKYLN
jgi:hypothetical protein